MAGFWQSLKKPFFVLAPMENVTDTVFRRVIVSCTAPDVFFTEFTSTGGIFSKGREGVIHRLQHTEEEKPLIAQIWGNKPEDYCKTAQLISEMGFAGIDINMGCPDKSVVRHACGSGLIKEPSLAAEIIQATKEGANGLDVSVKTRIGFNKIVTEEWAGFLLSQDISALTIHGRTKSEMSKVPAHWDEIRKVVNLRNQMKLSLPIIGNGDVKSYADGLEKVATYGVDGIMIGRGIFSDPWFFEYPKKDHDLSEHIDKLLLHTHLFTKTWGETKDFAILRKFYKAYIKDFDGASNLRMALMESRNPDEVENIVAEFRKSM